MAIRKILTYPNPELLKSSKPVTQFDASLKTLTDDMLETMRAANGIGLAAPQIGVHLNVVVMEIPQEDESVVQLVFCNPRLKTQAGHVAIEEGCLSLPEFFIEVDRSEKITLVAETISGETFEREEEGLMAICIQHEMDHLNGRLLVDYATKSERSEYRKIREKLEKEML